MRVLTHSVVGLVCALTVGLLTPAMIAADTTTTIRPESGPPGARVTIFWAEWGAGDCFPDQVGSVRIFLTQVLDDVPPTDPRLSEAAVVARDSDASDGIVGVTVVVPTVAAGSYNWRWYCLVRGPLVSGPFPFDVTPAPPATDTAMSPAPGPTVPWQVGAFTLLTAVAISLGRWRPRRRVRSAPMGGRRGYAASVEAHPGGWHPTWQKLRTVRHGCRSPRP